MKNLIKNVVRSFKNNKISLIGLIFLLFFGLGSFCVMSNTTANISNQYTSIAKQGNLHDFTASELYEIGNAAYLTSTNGFNYHIDNEGTKLTASEHLDKLSNDLFSKKTPPTENGDYYYIVPKQTLTKSHEEGDVYTRTYSFTLSDKFSTGLFKEFAQTGAEEYTKFNINIIETVEHETKSDVIAAVETLNSKAWNTWTDAEMQTLMSNNPLAADYNYFLKGIGDRTNLIFNVMTTKDTPLTRLLDSDKYKDEVQYRQFKSINVTATKDNVFYKVINSNPTDEIDKLVLFKDPKGNYGNELFKDTDWAPYNSQLKFYSINGTRVPLGTEMIFTVPSTFEELIVRPLTTFDEMDEQGWTNDEKFIYSQMMQIRFKRMLAADLSSDKQEDFEKVLATLAGVTLDPLAYYQSFIKPEGEIYQAYNDYLEYQKDWSENIVISMNGNIVINWITPTPMTCTMVNWSSHFSVINPQHLEANNKHVLDSKWLNDFEPFREWCYVTKGYYPSGSIDQSVAIEWFNSLTNAQFNFWWRPSTFSTTDKMVYTIYKKDGSGTVTVTVTKGTGAGQWNGLPDECIASCGNYYQIIWGCGLSPDFIYPVVDITRPTPNLKTECLTYVNDAGYKSLRLAFFNSPTEDFLVAKFMPSVTTTRQREIIDELNKFCSENMLYPKEVKAVYMASDTSNVLNSSAFRVSYIPSLVSIIKLITVILCSFLGILALVICLIIIKRYVENNRVNIGIMRANGISKMKIALSLFPFALMPALIGGIAAYLIGLFLQIPMLKLFGNYWTLPTPILGFDWVSMLVCVFMPFILFGIVTIIATLLVLRTKSVDLMKAGSEFKTNSFSKIAKKPFKHFGVLTRFRVALAFNSLSRLIVLALMSCLTMTSLVFAMTSFGKLNKSQAINSSQFDYSFNLQLTTPTTSGGNYNIEDWSKEAGTRLAGYGYANPDQYIYNVTWDTDEGGPAENLTKWYSHNMLELIDPYLIFGREYRTAIGDNGNLMLPTAADANGQKQDLQYLMNKTSSKLTLDYVVGLGSLSSNPWEIALALMPANSRNLASDAYNTIVEKIGSYIEQKAGGWEEFEEFFTHDEKTGELAKPYSLDIQYKSWLARFSASYAKFLVKIYTTPEFMKDEYRISYNIIPTNWLDTNEGMKKDELYTYITGKFKDISSKQRPTFDANHEITIEGIKDNSDYIKLTDSKGNNLNKLLYEKKEDDDYNWVIINAFAAHKYNLGVNSTFSINMSNMADRYERQMHPELFKQSSAKSDLAKFKVLAISQGTNGEAFYCKQKPANQLLGLPDGESWNSTHKYMMWQSSGLDPVQVIDLACVGTDSQHYPVYSVGEDGKVTKTEEVDRFNAVTPLGFNGIYTQNTSGKPITQGLSLYSYSGLYPGSSVFDADSMRTLLSYENNLPLANFMTGINNPAMNEAYLKYSQSSKTAEDLTTYMKSGIQPFIDELRKVYGDTTMVTCICGATDVAASDLIYKNLISTFNLAETSIMSVVIPITIIVVGIISNLIINDSKKMAAMLKALGYSDKKNAMSILALFVPTIILGLALAIPASMGICIGYQSLIFANANILIDVSRKWWYYLASIGGIGIVLVATYVVGWISLKRDRLVDQIKN